MKDKLQVGIVGAGQLGKMMGEAMMEMDISFIFYDSQKGACGGLVGDIINGEFNDTSKLNLLSEQAKTITCEFESVPSESLKHLAKTNKFLPPVAAFSIGSDRLKEKALFKSLKIDCANSLKVSSIDELHLAKEKLGLPFILKTSTGGYDGKGQILIDSEIKFNDKNIDFSQREYIAEQKIDFIEEVSCIITRSSSGNIVTYPLIKNIHENGILKVSIPEINHPLYETAKNYTHRLAEYLDYIGTLTIEYFVSSDGKLLANEIAPRVHNSGHWSIEGSQTSQFANHIKAILNYPLGDTALIKPCAMINLIGHVNTEISLDSGSYIHLYGKEARENRKIGHITLLADNREDLVKKVSNVYHKVYKQNIKI